MSRPRLAFLAIFACVVLGIGFLSYSSELTGQDYLKDFVLEQLEGSLGRKIDVRRAKFVVFPSIRVELSDVTIHDSQSDQVMLTAKRVDLVLRLLPLLQKQLAGKRLVIEEPTLTLRRNESGRWNVFDGGTDHTGADSRTVHMMAKSLMVKQATLVNGTVTVIDAARPDGIRSITFEHVEFGLLVRPERGLAELHLSATHQGSQEASAVSVDGVVKQSDQPVSLSGDDASGSTATGFQFDGRLDAANLKLREAADFLGPRPVSTHIQGALNLQSAVRVMPGVAGYDMVLSDMTARLNDITLTGKANLAGLLTPQPTFAVTFSSSLVALPQLLKTIPAEWIHPQLPALLTDRQINGKVQVMNATLTGSTTAGPQLSTTGEFRIQDGEGLIGRDRVVSKDLAAVVMVEVGRVRISRVTGMYGAMQITEGKAVVSFLDAGPWLELEITGSMGAAQLLDFLGKTIKTERVAQLFAGIREAEGATQAMFRLVGPLNQSSGIAFTGGEIIPRQVSLSYAGLSERVTGIQGRFVLGDGVTLFDQVSGRLGNMVVQLQGTMTGGAASQFQDFGVRASGDVAQLARLTKSQVIPHGTFEGGFSSVLSISGPTATPHIRGSAVLDQAKIVLGSVEKPVGAPLTVEFEGDVAKAGGTILDHLELVLPAARIPVNGMLQIGDHVVIDATVALGNLSLSGLPEWIAKGGFEAGNLEVALDIKGRELDWKAWRVTGWMALTNGLMLVKGGDGYIQDMYARVKFVRNGAELKRLAFTVQHSDIAVEATLRNWMTKPIITGKLESNQLDLDLLIPKGERTALREFLETVAATSQVTMSATAANGHYKHLKFSGLSARLNIQDGVLDIDRISGETVHGQVAGRVVVQLPPKAPAELEMSLRATGVEADDLLKLTKTQTHGISGETRLSGMIRGHGRNPHGVYPSLNGKVEVLLENGRILKSKERAVWKIVSLLNVPAVLQGKVDLEKEGLPYNKISASVSVQNGIFHTENLIIDSPILKITAAGSYDLPTDQLDGAVAVSPFGSYSQFLKTIPLFGRIVAGDRTGMATAMFSVKGTIADPDVTYLPVKSFASGLSGLAQLAVDVLKNTLTLPMDLVTPNDETGSRSPGMGSDPVPVVP